MDSTIPGVEDDLEACSQHSNYSNFGDQDITGLIENYSTQPTTPTIDEGPPIPRPNFNVRNDSDLSTEPATQSTASGPPDSSASGLNLGKRKANDSINSDNSRGPFRPSKLQRGSLPTPPLDEANNPFLGNSPPPPPPPENPFGPICFSPPQTLQRIFNNKKLPYGVQYELARYVSRGKLQYKDFHLPWLEELPTNNHDSVPAFKKLVAGISFDVDVPASGEGFEIMFAKERASRSPWRELDTEEEALAISPYSGLGFTDKGEHVNWHGGQVLFHARLTNLPSKGCTKPEYKLTLQPAELCASKMFARRFGSRSFLNVKLTKSASSKNIEELMDYLRRPIILCGGVFRAFYAKEGTVFYVKTNETFDGTSVSDDDPVPDTLSLLEFVQWHNPMEYNNKQSMAKWASRFALGLSTSVPGIRIEQEDIKIIEDIMSIPEGSNSEPSNMTDGAGKINRWSLNQLRHRLGWDDKPTAIQTRIFGSKGLLVDDGKHAEERTYVELTPSQKKIRFPENVEMDPAHRIVDVLRASHFKTPSRLSVETIINLAENGVKKDAFFKLLENSLSQLVDPLTDWDSPDASRRIWADVCRIGGVMSARRAREQIGLARVMGYSEKDTDNAEDDETGGSPAGADEEERSVAYWVNEISGCPSSLEEIVMSLLDSGFTFQDCRFLREQLKALIKGRIDKYIKSYRIDVPMSATAFLVPDTLGVLEPGEVFFKSSKRKFITADGVESDIFVGDVLVTRHPCKLPTDIQKWKSVDKTQLYHLLDVIVCSTKGTRRAADYLGGGDYDGDKGIFIWQPELVEPFKNAPLHFADPPKNILSYFSRENEEVAAFQSKVRNTSKENQIRQLQNALLGAVRTDSVVGKYSTYHDIAIYTLGYAHPETIRLAYMFCMSLDGIKSGLTVDKKTMMEDSKKYSKRAPKWKETEEERGRYDSNERNVARPKTLGKFIMDELYNHAGKEGDTWKIKLDTAFKSDSLHNKQDMDLSNPWIKATALAERHKVEGNRTQMAEDLEKIKKHVEAVFHDFLLEMSGGGSPRKPSFGSPKKAAFSEQSIGVRQDKLRALSKKFVSGPKNLFLCDEEIARCRASYAYIYDYQMRKSGRYPFQMAMRELGQIKAQALGRPKTVHGDFYDFFNMKPPKSVAA